MGYKNLAKLSERICGLVGRAKGNEFHPDLPVLAATDGDEVLSFPGSQRVYMQVGCLYHCGIIPKWNSNGFVGEECGQEFERRNYGRLVVRIV